MIRMKRLGAYLIEPTIGERDLVVAKQHTENDTHLDLGKLEANATMAASSETNPLKLSTSGVLLALGDDRVAGLVLTQESFRFENHRLIPLLLNAVLNGRRNANLEATQNNILYKIAE